MNKLLLSAALLSTCCISCYKEKDPADVKAILVSHKWFLTGGQFEGAPITTDCALNETLTFKKDSTGYFYNATPCDTPLNHPDSTSFTWYITADRKNIVFRNMGGVSGKNNALGIGDITNDHLRLFGAFNTKAAEFIYDQIDR